MRTAFREAHVPSMPIARLMLRSHLSIAVTYLAIYVLLDWVSYVHPSRHRASHRGIRKPA
jgi:hypothetical protein